ncbi:MAG: AtpZ/AtpI family protein [Armatimonadetes bacterium]|nr:AtpZ/AtpI family protein [Armatimonadota bacterium]
MRDPENRELLRQMGILSTVGVLMVVATGIGYLFGSWLDRQLGTSPWLMVVCTTMGVAAGFIELFRTVLRIIREQERGGRR